MNIITQPHSQKIVDLILSEVDNFKTKSIDLSDKTKFCQYQTIQENITQQNHGFLTDLAPGQVDDREVYDIVTPMVETGVSNGDLDSENIETYTDDPEHQEQEILSKVLIKRYNRQTNQGINLNEMVYQLYDDGNIVVRRVNNDGELYRPVLPQNLIIVDPSARTLEDTAVIERDTKNQSEVRGMNWENTDLLFNYCDLSETDLIPYYEIYYYYGDLTKKRLGNVKKEVHGTPYKYVKGDNTNYVQSFVVIARAKDGVRNEEGKQVPGFVLFAEELKPQTIKITNKLSVKRYKPYESVRLGKYNGKFWGDGYRSTGRPYQNRANELGNQIREIMKLASKMVFWSKDKNIAGKNILSAIKNGQILQADDLQLLNNVFPNLSLFAEEWNRNIAECQKALKAFEAASGESLPSSTSATAVIAQTQAIGKYFDFKRERFGLFLSVIYKRWILPDLLKGLEENETLELLGDVSLIDDILTYYVKGQIYKGEMLDIALSGGVMYKQAFELLVDQKKEELKKQPKLFMTILKDFFKGIELYVGVNVTGEGFNKQNKLTNLLQMINLSKDPMITQNPDVLNDLNEARQMLGLRPIKGSKSPMPAMPLPGQPGQPGNPNPTNMPMIENSAVPTNKNNSVKGNML